MSRYGFVLAAHGELAPALLESAEMILGQQNGVVTIKLMPSMNLEALEAELREAIERVDQGAGVMVMIDLFGGTPSNAAALCLRSHDCAIVTGVNLPMVLETLLAADGAGSLEELSRVAIDAGRAGIVDVAAKFAAMKNNSEARPKES